MSQILGETPGEKRLDSFGFEAENRVFPRELNNGGAE
jgi:hypothetical protein